MAIGWIIKFNVKNVDAFRRAAEGAVAAVKAAEPGVVVYECFVSEDRTMCIVHEWFADQKAALAHMTGVAPREHLPKVLEVAELVGIDVYGTPGPELAAVLAAFPVKSRNTELIGFTRAG